jgi:hypothetical protein
MLDAVDAQGVRPKIEVGTPKIIHLNPRDALAEILKCIDANKKNSPIQSDTFTSLQYGSKIARMEMAYTLGSPINVSMTIMDVSKYSPWIREQLQITDLPKEPGQTTELYRQIGGILQEVASHSGRNVVQTFSTPNQNMIKWMRANAAELGFRISQDDGRSMLASRAYMPLARA